MWRKRIFILFLIIAMLLCTSCKNNDEAKEAQLSSVREYATRYNFLSEAEYVIENMAQVLAVYDSASYSRVRDSMRGKLSDVVEMLWFPYVNYPGAEIFEKKKTASVVALYVTSAQDELQTFICLTDVTFYDGSVRHYYHEATYNITAKKITNFEEIYSYA